MIRKRREPPFEEDTFFLVLPEEGWKVERTIGWLNRYRRLKVCYERRDDIHLAFLYLSCALICWNFILRMFC